MNNFRLSYRDVPTRISTKMMLIVMKTIPVANTAGWSEAPSEKFGGSPLGLTASGTLERSLMVMD